MRNTTPPTYAKLKGLYAYGQLFRVLHPGNPPDEQYFAYGDLIQADRDHWYMVLAYLYQAGAHGATPPLLCPAESTWTQGYECGVSFVQAFEAGQSVDAETYAAERGVEPAMLIAGYGYYLFPEHFDAGDGRLLDDVLALLGHL
jgi:hypothetical protein